jgi:hypothetical protein
LRNFLVLGFLLFLYNNLSLNNYKIEESLNYKSEKEIYFFVKKFEKNFNTTTNISISFFHLNKETLGLCLLNSEDRKILISYSAWDNLLENQKEELVYHELGHCLFNLEHDDNRIFLGICPSSIMNSEIFSNLESKVCYTLLKNYYIADLASKLSNKKY